MNAKSSAKPTADRPSRRPPTRSPQRLRKKRNRNKRAAVPASRRRAPQGDDQAVLADPKLKFPFYFPTLRTQRRRLRGHRAARSTRIRDEQGSKHKAYRLVVSRGSPASTTASRA